MKNIEEAAREYANKMTKKELFKKYNIKSKLCKQWEREDEWISVDLYRLMHNGELPNSNDTSLAYILDFLDKKDLFMGKSNFISLFLTAKRSVYRFHENILIEINNKEK